MNQLLANRSVLTLMLAVLAVTGMQASEPKPIHGTCGQRTFNEEAKLIGLIFGGAFAFVSAIELYKKFENWQHSKYCQIEILRRSNEEMLNKLNNCKKTLEKWHMTADYDRCYWWAINEAMQNISYIREVRDEFAKSFSLKEHTHECTTLIKKYYRQTIDCCKAIIDGNHIISAKNFPTIEQIDEQALLASNPFLLLNKHDLLENAIKLTQDLFIKDLSRLVEHAKYDGFADIQEEIMMLINRINDRIVLYKQELIKIATSSEYTAQYKEKYRYN